MSDSRAIATFEWQSDCTASECGEVLHASRTLVGGVRQTELSVPAMHCGGCMARVEQVLAALPGVEQARVNLSTRRVAVRWHGDTPPPMIAALGDIGYDAHLDDPEHRVKDPAFRELVTALAVAGFAAGNIMMLSVAVWAGADPATRDLFHWLSALIAIPALVWSGRIFFRSAWQALRGRRTNMDVPISVGVALAFGLSLGETITHGPHAYFDAATSLLFVLLIGRTLDHLVRERARAAVLGLARLAPRTARVRQPDGAVNHVPVDDVAIGMTILLAAGERVPVDSRVAEGRSDIDASLVSGESEPVSVAAGSLLVAGALNLTAPLTLVATAAARDSFLAEMTRMMEAAETGRGTYRRIADRAARLYAPVVHLTALLTFVGWLIATGDAHQAATIAIAVLIITCPCALGLAVPMVQVVAARRLFAFGILVKDGGALERLVQVDCAVFDKTGTVTLGIPRLAAVDEKKRGALAIAAALAMHSRHPYALALAAATDGSAPTVIARDPREEPGSGIEAEVGEVTYRLGRGEWTLAPSGTTPPEADVLLAADGRCIAAFCFDETLRPGAAGAIGALAAQGLPARLLSGDREARVRQLALALGMPYAARLSPRQKVERIVELAQSGHRVLMVGDGLNDVAAMASAHVSIAPATASDISRRAADLVFLRDNLLAVPQAVDIARRASRLVRQNLALAIGYNAIAVPIAILGQATPLVAAISMSLSSAVVVGNALRLRAPVPPAASRPGADPTATGTPVTVLGQTG